MVLSPVWHFCWAAIVCKALRICINLNCLSRICDHLYGSWPAVNVCSTIIFTALKDSALVPWYRVMSMPYPPPSLLPIPTGLVHLPQPIAGLELHDLQLMTAEEEQSNQQLFHSVRC